MWEYVKGSEADFEGAPEWATVVSQSASGRLAFEESTKSVNGNKWAYVSDKVVFRYENCRGLPFKNIIAERRKVDNLQSRTNDANLQQVFDTVQRPAHYNQSGIECIDAIAASMSAEEFRGFLKGNVQKYVWRSEHKNGVEDYRKAQYYLDRLVKELNK